MFILIAERVLRIISSWLLPFPIAHYELCAIPSSSYYVSYIARRRQFWSLNHLSKKVKEYNISYEALTDAEKAMKETLLSFSNSEIHYNDIAEAKSVDERRKIFGTSHILFFVVCNYVCFLTRWFSFSLHMA